MLKYYHLLVRLLKMVKVCIIKLKSRRIECNIFYGGFQDLELDPIIHNWNQEVHYKVGNENVKTYKEALT